MDGPPCADPAVLAASLADPLRALGRPLVHVRADGFWRDASLRFEHGREDVDAYLGWLDDGALRREVLTGDQLPAFAARSGQQPRHPRATPRPLPATPCSS